MLSQGEGRAQRRELDLQREHAHREKLRATLRDLRRQLREARGRRDEALSAVKQTCRAQRIELRDKALERRKNTLAALRETYARERKEAREACLARQAEVHAEARDPIERARGKWEAERKYQDDLRRIEMGYRERHRQAHRAHVAERRSESDDVVVSNIPQDYRALWERMKRSIKGSTRQSRSEEFMAYVEAHPDELLQALSEDSDRVVRELEEQQAKAERALRPPPSSKRRKYTSEELASVPF